MSDSDFKKDLEKTFRDLFNNDDAVRKLYGKIQQKTATYQDAQRFAKRVGELATEAFRLNASEEMFPIDGKQDEMIDSIIGLLRVDHEIVSDAAATVQKNLNTKAGIGLNAVEVSMDLDRASGIAQNVSEQPDQGKAVSRMGAAADNYSQHVVDESVRQNAKFQWKAGMNPKIVRKADSGACKWCRALAGVYDYADVKDTGNDVFRRHENCGCTVEYIADGKKAQDVWSKATYRRDDASDRVNSIKSIGEARQKKQAQQLKERTARAEAISRVQAELGYSAKGASIWYNQNKGYIERYGLDYVLEATKNSRIYPYSKEKSDDIQAVLSPEDKHIYSSALKMVDEANEKFDSEFYDSSKYLNAVVFGNEEHYHSTVVGMQHSSTIILGKRWKDPEMAFAELSEDNSHIKTSDPRSVYAHEYGHYVIDAIALQSVGYKYNTDNYLVYSGVSNGEQKKLVDHIYKEFYTGNEDLIENSVSERASESVDEFIAESFAQHFYGDEHSQIAEDLISFLKNRWKNVQKK